MEKIDVKIRIFPEGHQEAGDGYLDLINGAEGYVIVTTDVDKRQLMINIEQLKLALRKMTTK